MHTEDNILYKTTSPLTFLAWLESQSSISRDYSVNLKNYQNYVNSWHVSNRSSDEKIRDVFVSQYVNLLNEIALTYATEEEKRFITNCNFTKPEELDAVLPFFIQKLKVICLYYYEKRERLKQKIAQLPGKGTERVASSIIRNLILEDIQTENLQVLADTKFTVPSLSAINENLLIRIVDLYDNEDYSNKPTSIKQLDVDPNLFLDFKEAIIQAIKQYPVFSSTFASTFSFNLLLSGGELDLLKQRDFQSYVVSSDVDDLKLQLYRNFSTKYLGSDMYYLSTDSTLFSINSGKLLTTAPLSGNVVLNLQNTRYPSTAFVPNLSSIYTAFECGRFFVPSKTGALRYSTFSKTFHIDKEKLKPNKVYVFPDPNVIGDIVDYYGENDPEYPLYYEIDVSPTRVGYTNAFRFGDVFSSSLNQLFYPYESYTQDVFKSSLGLSTPYDDVSFWSGEKDTFWTNSDIWPDLSVVERLQIDQRLSNLLINQGQMVKWFVDIYGNEYGLYKQDVTNISDKKLKAGKLYVKTTSNVVSSFDHYYRNFLVKYPSFITKEIQEGVYNLFVQNDVILVETKNYVMVDVIDYSPEQNVFVSSQYAGFYKKKYSIDSNIEKLIGYAYREDNDSLYLCFTSLLPQLSSTNYKKIIPYVYKFDRSAAKLIQVYPDSNNTDLYSLSAISDPPQIDLKYVQTGHFSHKQKYNLYNLTYIAYNLNNIPYIVNEKFYSTPYSEKLVTTNPILYKPFFYVYDTNFSLHDIKSETGFSSPYTDYAGHYEPEKFKFHNIEQTKENVFAVSLIDPVFINRTGTYFLHFDWSSYNLVNLFFGCSSQNVLYTEDSIIFPGRKIITDPNVWEDILTFDTKNKTFFVKAKILPNTNNSIMEFYVGEQTVIEDNGTIASPFTGIFCDFPYSIFKEVTIQKVGDGQGIVTSDPYCVQCGEICKFLYPIGSTVSFRASAFRESVFSGWEGGNCDGVAGDCFLQVTDNITLTAIFTRLPRYDLTISSNIPGTIITSLDNQIACVGPFTCTYNFLGGTPISLSASTPPDGYNFKGFLGSSCGDDRVCSFFLNNNLTLTAFYEPAVSTLLLENKYTPYENPTRYWYLAAVNSQYPDGIRIGCRDFDASTMPGSGWPIKAEGVKSIAVVENTDYKWDGSPGTIFCSLCPGFSIKYFLELPVPTGTTASLSSNCRGPYEFAGYFGEACEGIAVDCSFRVRGLLSVSAVFVPPPYFLLVKNYAAPVNYNVSPFYVNTVTPLSTLGYIKVDTEDDGINCNTYKVNQTCASVYLCGAVVDTYVTPYPGSKVHALWGTEGTFISGSNVAATKAISATIYITTNTILSTFSEAQEYNTLTVTKSSVSPEVVGRVVMTPGIPGEGSYTMGFAENTKTLTYPKSVEIEVLPLDLPNVSKTLYTVGFSGLKYVYSADPSAGLTLAPNNSIFDQITPLSIGGGAGVNIIGTFGPYYSLRGGLINVDFKESTLVLDDNANVTVVFDSLLPVPTPTPTATPTPTPTPTPSVEYVDVEGTVLPLTASSSYIIASSGVSNFTLLPDSVSAVYVTNYFTLSNFNECYLTLSTTSSISANKFQIFVGDFASLSANNNNLYTLNYYNTGSSLLGFTFLNNPTPLQPLLGYREDILRPGCFTYPLNKETFANETVIAVVSSASDKPDPRAYRHPFCLRYLIVRKSSGTGISYRQIGTTVNNLNLFNTLYNNSISGIITNFTLSSGCYGFQVEFYGWKTSLSGEEISLSASDTYYKVKCIKIQ